MTNASPIISVVIPTHGRTDSLIRAVESALRQTFTDLEVIVVIDGADPSAANALDRLCESRLRYIELPDKVGGAEARNIGARDANGSWVALLDDDDEWLPDKLEKQLAAAATAAGDSVLVTSTYICRSPGVDDVLRPRRFPRPGEAPAEFMFDYLCYFQTSTFLCSTQLIRSVPFDKSAAFFQDIDWFLRVTKAKGFELRIVREPLSIYNLAYPGLTITNGLSWVPRLQWGRDRRHLMSRRAYSRFIVGSCVGRAVQDGAGWKGFVSLFYEMFVKGSPTPYLVAMLIVAYMLPPQKRKSLRNRLFLAKSNKLGMVVPGK